MFAALYLGTRSTILIGDAAAFVEIASKGDPSHLHYGELGHFLQTPLTRGLWLTLSALGVPVSVASVSVAFSLVGTLAAIICVGLIAGHLQRTRSAAWIAALLFGTSLHSMTQWNGELYGLALGFVSAALLLTLRGRWVAPAILFALSVLSHADFVLAAPAMAWAAWQSDAGRSAPRQLLGRISRLMLVAGGATLVVLLVGSYAIGKWHDGPTFMAWIERSHTGRQPDIAAEPEVTRALKGLVTAFTVAGHHWRDIMTGRGQVGMPGFVPAAGVGLAVLALTAIFVMVAVRQRQLCLFALVWIVPFHVLFNWWFVPTVEKYHAGALPGFVLLVTAGLVTVGSHFQTAGRRVLFGAYIAACAGLNLASAVLPMQALGVHTAETARELRSLAIKSAAPTVFIACDDPKAVRGAGVPWHRLRSVWRGTESDIQSALISWTTDRLQNGEAVYLVGRWCLPEEWNTSGSTAPFDLHFLSSFFLFTPTHLMGIPVSESVPTNPFQWVRGDVVRLTAKAP